ncbi:hypothetical protein EAF00_005668 [Botryotinia globosa]|nr:hypothetical protein EAF00_005668 [Botryotinia globosa]
MYISSDPITPSHIPPESSHLVTGSPNIHKLAQFCMRLFGYITLACEECHWSCKRYGTSHRSASEHGDEGKPKGRERERDEDDEEEEKFYHPYPSTMQLDRPADDELVQLFVKRGQGMRALVMGVGNLCARDGKDAGEGSKVLGGLGMERLRVGSGRELGGKIAEDEGEGCDGVME